MINTNIYMKSIFKPVLSVMLAVSAIVYSASASAQALCCDKTATGVCVQPMPARPSASRVSEQGRYGDLYSRMDKLDTGNCANAYYLHKTQAWLNLSRDLQHEGDGRTAVNAAYDEAEKIIKALDEGKTPSSETAMIQDAEKLRPDLWQIATDRKSTPALLSSAAREVAYCEVYLVRAGHAQTNLGGRARVEPLIGMAQDICQAAKDKAPCAVPVVVAPAPAPVAPAPVVAAPAAVVVAPAPVAAPVQAPAPQPKRAGKQDRY
jgi:OmpA-OmpF porin, OOP family